MTPKNNGDSDLCNDALADVARHYGYRDDDSSGGTDQFVEFQREGADPKKGRRHDPEA